MGSSRNSLRTKTDRVSCNYKKLIECLSIKLCFETDARITESEMLALRDKTNRHMRLREQLLLHSKTSNLIVM